MDTRPEHLELSELHTDIRRYINMFSDDHVLNSFKIFDAIAQYTALIKERGNFLKPTTPEEMIGLLVAYLTFSVPMHHNEKKEGNKAHHSSIFKYMPSSRKITSILKGLLNDEEIQADRVVEVATFLENLDGELAPYILKRLERIFPEGKVKKIGVSLVIDRLNKQSIGKINNKTIGLKLFILNSLKLKFVEGLIIELDKYFKEIVWKNNFPVVGDDSTIAHLRGSTSEKTGEATSTARIDEKPDHFTIKPTLADSNTHKTDSAFKYNEKDIEDITYNLGIILDTLNGLHVSLPSRKIKKKITNLLKDLVQSFEYEKFSKKQLPKYLNPTNLVSLLEKLLKTLVLLNPSMIAKHISSNSFNEAKNDLKDSIINLTQIIDNIKICGGQGSE